MSEYQGQAGRYILSLLIAGGLLTGIYFGEKKVREALRGKEIQKNERLGFDINNVMNSAMVDGPKKALQEIVDMDVSNASKDKKILWHEAVADLYNMRVEQFPDEAPVFFLNKSLKNYDFTLKESTDPIVLNRVREKLVKIRMNNDHWHEAIAMINQLLKEEPVSERENELLLTKVQCLKNLRDIKGTLKILDYVLENDPSDEMVIRVQTLRGGIWLNTLEKLEKINPDEINLEDYEGVPNLDNLDALRKDIENLYESTLAIMNGPDPRRSEVLNGLLMVCLSQNDMDKAYEYVKEVQRDVLPVDERARSLFLLARMELMKKNPEKAEEILRICLNEFPQKDKAVKSYMLLYDLLREQQRYLEALEVLEELSYNNSKLNAVRMILSEMHPEKSSFVNVVNEIPESGRKRFMERLHNLLDRVDRGSEMGVGWREINDDIKLYHVGIDFYGKDFYNAQKKIEQYLVKSLVQKHREIMLFLDIETGVNLKKPAPVIAYRTQRYLNTYPKGRWNADVLRRLLDSYYELGFFSDVIDTAQLAFANEVLKAAQSGNKELEAKWSSNVARLAQCHYALGINDKANLLFRRVMPGLVKQRLGDEKLYLDWGNTALNLKQKKEALRRFLLGITILEPQKNTDLLKMARDVLKIELKEKSAMEAVLKMMPYYRGLKDENHEKRKALRKLYEALFEDILSNGRSGFEELFSKYAEDFPEDPKLQYFTLRFLASKGISKNNVDQIPESMKEIWKGNRNQDNTATEQLAAMEGYVDKLNGLASIESRVDKLKEKGL